MTGEVTCPSFFSSGLMTGVTWQGGGCILRQLVSFKFPYGLGHTWDLGLPSVWKVGCSSQGAKYTSHSLEPTWNSSSKATCSQ